MSAAGTRVPFEPASRSIDSAGNSLLAELIEPSVEPGEGVSRRFASSIDFLAEKSARRALERWLGALPQNTAQWETACRSIERDIARIDRLLADQVNAILHHPRFQQLEATWRGLLFLLDSAEKGRDILDNDSARGAIVVKILNVSKKELSRDMRRNWSAAEFDQSDLFKKIYEAEFGTAGGHPFGLLIGDYTFSHRLDDVDLLTSIGGVAAAAFAPFVAGAHPDLLGIDSFASLEQPINFNATFQQVDYLKWHGFRDHPDSRFVGLALPRILLRRSYDADNSQSTRFVYSEDVEGPDSRNYLWGNAAFAFASVVIRAYATSGWFADIRGSHRVYEEGGLVTGLPATFFRTDAMGTAVKMGTEVAISDYQEKELCKHGLMPLCDCKDTGLSVFYSNPSTYEPKQYDDSMATLSERMESMLQYTLCASRFAHYVKVVGQDKIGSFKSATEIERFFNNWLIKYVTSDSKALPSTKAKFPLRVAEVQVVEVPGEPGHYQVILRLCPHYQLDELQATIRLVPRLSPGAAH